MRIRRRIKGESPQDLYHDISRMAGLAFPGKTSKRVMNDIKKREAQDKIRKAIVAAGMMSPEASVAQAAAVEASKRPARRLKSEVGKTVVTCSTKKSIQR